MTALSLLMDASALKKALAAVNPHAPSDKVLPILTHVLIEADGEERAAVTATDLQLRTRVVATAENAMGAAAIPGRPLYDFVSRLHEGSQVSIRVADGLATVISGRSRIKLRTLDAAEFPPDMEVAQAVSSVRMKGSALGGLLSRVAHAVALDQSRLHLCGVLLELYSAAAGWRFRLVACDGVRLEWREGEEVEILSKDVPSAILPTASAEAFRKAAGATEGEATLTYEPRRAILEAGPVRLTSQLIDQRYPYYRRVVPKRDNHKTLSVVDLAVLARAVDTTLTVATDKGRGLRVSVSETTLVIDRCRDVAEIESGVEAETDLGEGVTAPFLFGVNGAFLKQALDALGAETIDLRFLKENVIHLSRHNAPDDGSSCSIITPMRLDSGTLSRRE